MGASVWVNGCEYVGGWVNGCEYVGGWVSSCVHGSPWTGSECESEMTGRPPSPPPARMCTWKRR